MSFYNMRYMEKDKDKDKSVGECRKNVGKWQKMSGVGGPMPLGITEPLLTLSAMMFLLLSFCWCCCCWSRFICWCCFGCWCIFVFKDDYGDGLDVDVKVHMKFGEFSTTLKIVSSRLFSCDFGFRLFVLVLRSESQVKINVQWWTWSKGKTKIG